MIYCFNVLYVEDDPQDVDLTKAHFAEKAPDIRIQIAGSGAECFECLDREKFDLLLLDHHLPDTDGLDLLASISRRRLDVPVVLVTGVGDEDLVVRALRLGAANYVPKQGEYIQALPEVIRATIESRRRRRSEGVAAYPSVMRILYVEHVQMDIELTLRHFEEAAPHFTVEVVTTCGAALDRLSGQHSFDLVLVDLRMPDQSGLECLREAIRRRLRLPPFIVISGRGDEAAAIATLTLGAADYISKREGYLNQLTYCIEHAISRDRLTRLNEQLRIELAERERAETERMKLEAQLRQSQKMEAIGQLAGGIAHDFNNILAAMMMQAELALNVEGMPAEVRDGLVEIGRAAERAAALTRQLLLFSRRQVMVPRGLDLNEAVIGMSKMLGRIVGEDVEMQLRLQSAPLFTHADPGMIDQVLMNLTVNARDAMPRGGRLTIETAELILDPEGAAQIPDATPGRYVSLAVRDTGCGIPPEIMPHIFEPFFTTKEAGKGTGLGLATVFGIVKQHGGWISLESEGGRGTTFTVFLPQADPTDEATAVSRVRTSAERRRGSEVILVVEDDAPLRGLTRRVLEGNGYSVIEAASGVEAHRIWNEPGRSIALLLTDMVMPEGLDGRDLAARLRAERRDLKVVFTSGYSPEYAGREIHLEPGQDFIQKPWNPDRLLETVRRCLDG